MWTVLGAIRFERPFTFTRDVIISHKTVHNRQGASTFAQVASLVQDSPLLSGAQILIMISSLYV